MSDKTPASDLLLDPEALSHYGVQHPRQIKRLMREIMRKRAVLTAFIDAGEESFITAIIDADDERILLDVSPNTQINTRALAADTVTCQAILDGVRVQFDVRGLGKDKHDGEDVFTAAAPQSAIRLQRRDGFRMPVPRTRALTLSLHLPEAEAPTAVTVDNTSTTGIGFVLATDELGEAELNAGQVLEACTLTLPDGAEATLDIRVRHAREFHDARGRSMLRVGCQFTELPIRFEAQLQRYLFQLERKQTRY